MSAGPAAASLGREIAGVLMAGLFAVPMVIHLVASLA